MRARNDQRLARSGPVAVHQPGLRVKSLRLVSAHRQGQRSRPGGRQPRRRHRPRRMLRELQIALQKRRLAHRLQVVHPRQRESPRWNLGRQIVAVPIEAAGQHHGRQMRARRMPRQNDARTIHAKVFRPAPDPRQRLHHIAHDLLQRRPGGKRVIHHHHMHPARYERRRDETVISLVQRTPPAPVDKHQTGRQPRRGRGEPVQRLRNRIAIRQIEQAGPVQPRLLRVALPAREIIGPVGHQLTIVELAVEHRSVVTHHPTPPGSNTDL